MTADYLVREVSNCVCSLIFDCFGFNLLQKIVYCDNDGNVAIFRFFVGCIDLCQFASMDAWELVWNAVLVQLYQIWRQFSDIIRSILYNLLHLYLDVATNI